MASGTYTGTSKVGSFEEALRFAIAAAKQDLHTDLVTWALDRVSGENGGFVLQDDLTVTITAQAPAVK